MCHQTQVIQAVPNALGALCLNQVGQEQLKSRPTIIPGLLSIFTSERHLQVLQDKENAVLIGTSIDELIRHHPVVKTAVLDAIKSTLSKIEDMGNAYEVPADMITWYQLVAPSNKSGDGITAGDEDVAMGDATPSTATLRTATSEATATTLGAKDKNSPPHDNNVVMFIDILGRVRYILTPHNDN